MFLWIMFIGFCIATDGVKLDLVPAIRRPILKIRHYSKKLPMIVKESMAGLPRKTLVRILFEDEARFGRLSDQRRCWAPMWERPIVRRQVIREFVYALAAVCPASGEIPSLIMPWVATEVMSIFFAHTALELKGAHCLMFLDRARWHIARDLRVPKSITLLPLPSHSPELNPVEHICGTTCGKTISETRSLIPWIGWKIPSVPVFMPWEKIRNWFLHLPILTGSKL